MYSVETVGLTLEQIDGIFCDSGVKGELLKEASWPAMRWWLLLSFRLIRSEELKRKCFNFQIRLKILTLLKIDSKLTKWHQLSIPIDSLSLESSILQHSVIDPSVIDSQAHTSHSHEKQQAGIRPVSSWISFLRLVCFVYPYTGDLAGSSD